VNGAVVLIRADASPSGGVGHVMRSIALAQELTARGATVHFACRSLTSLARDRLRDEGFATTEVDSAATLGEVTAATAPDWTVVDLGTAFEPAELGDLAGRVLVVDDLGQAFRSWPDLVLNQNLHAAGTVYTGVDDDRILRGPTYLLFRDEFLRALAARDDTPRRGVLLSLGGTDPLRLTLPFTDAIAAAVEAPLVVFASSAHPDIARLRGRTAATRALALHEDVRDVTRFMVQAELAVTSGGTTVWELAALGVPTLVGSVAPIEDLTLAGLREHGLFDVLGRLDQLDPHDLAARVRQRLANPTWLAACGSLARSTVDGHGRRRVADAMEYTSCM
jgi:UDP-2,4-diacetamido-2,4,6-trideoxy-beta-L-altropyranose hydrolase